MIIDEKLVNDFRKKHNLIITIYKIACAMNESADKLLGLNHISRSKR